MSSFTSCSFAELQKRNYDSCIPCILRKEVYCIESMLQKNALDTIYQKCPILYYGTPINERIYGPSFSLLKDYSDIHLSPLFSKSQCQNCYVRSFMSTPDGSETLRISLPR